MSSATQRSSPGAVGMDEEHGPVLLKDATLREGFDVPGLTLTREQRAELATRLAELRISEVEFVAPGRFRQDMEILRALNVRGLGFSTTGLLWAAGETFRSQVQEASVLLDRFDLLMPLSPGRPPQDPGEKTRRIVEATRVALDLHPRVGVGFPHSTQVEIGFLQDICGQVVREGVERITLYDTNGSADPFEVMERIHRVREVAPAVIGFHAHNDLGMATANSLAAVRAGATCLDVTVNGLGDRAGNASLEQVAVALSVKGVAVGVRLELLKELSAAVAAMTGIPVSPLAPIVGEFAFMHKSPNHLGISELFEAFDPAVVRARRTEVTE